MLGRTVDNYFITLPFVCLRFLHPAHQKLWRLGVCRVFVKVTGQMLEFNGRGGWGKEKSERASERGGTTTVARERKRMATCFAPRSAKDYALSCLTLDHPIVALVMRALRHSCSAPF